jgi:hypothetical protein
MDTPQALFAEARNDLVAVVQPLFGYSEKCLRERGSFTPHAAVLGADGKVSMIGAMSNAPGATGPVNVLPILCKGLRSMAQERSLTAIGIAESVTVNPNGAEATEAIRVLFEHSNGLTVAMYMPFNRSEDGEFAFGETYSVLAQPAISAWAPN